MSVAIPGVSRDGRTHTFALIERITLASTVAGDLPEWRSHSGYRQLAGCPHRSWAAGAVVGVSEPGPGLRPARDPPAVPDRSSRAVRLPAGLPGFLSVGASLGQPDRGGGRDGQDGEHRGAKPCVCLVRRGEG